MRTLALVIGIAALVAAGCSSGDDSNPTDVAAPADVLADITGIDTANDVPPPPPDEGTAPDVDPGSARRLVILHTNDLHDHLTGLGPEADYSPATTGDDAVLGGFARLAKRITDERAAATDPVLLIDAGDHSMGTLFETLYVSHAPVLSIFETLGYDFATIGNHEFDWGPAALAAMLRAYRAAHPDSHLAFVASNLVFDAENPADDDLAALAADGYLAPTRVVTLSNGLKVGLFGLLGDVARDDAPFMPPVTTRPPIDAARDAVTALEAEGVDLIVCISHSGVAEVAGMKSEDEELAAAVPEIDVIVSGHTHTTLPDGIRTDEAIIVQTGYYGQNLGRLEVALHDDGTKTFASTLLPVDDSVGTHAATAELVAGYVDTVDTALAGFGRTYGQVVAETGFDIPRESMAENAVGDLTTDAMLAAANRVLGANPAIGAFTANGVLRAALAKGETGAIQFADIFRVAPLGAGPDGVAGYPLVSFYVTAAELRDAFEVIPSATPMVGDSFYVQASGLRMEYDPTGTLFQKVLRVYLGDATDPLDTSDANTALYRIVTDLYIGSQLARLGSATFNQLVVTAKAADGTPYADLRDAIIDADPAAEGVQEIKVWQALADYMEAFPDADADGIADVPERYSESAGRFVIVP